MFDLANRSSGKVGRGLVAFLASFCAIGCGYFTGYPKVGSPDIRVSEVRYTMGTLLDLTIYASSEERGRQLLDGAFTTVEGAGDLRKGHIVAIAHNNYPLLFFTEIGEDTTEVFVFGK